MLSLGVRSGPFVVFSSNFTTQVLNDPGQGIYVAIASDSTGASGAWVRQFSGPYDMAFWGIVGDGVLTPATGSIALPTNPTNTTTVTVGTTSIEFVTSGATGNQVNIGGSAAATVAALLTFLQASGDGQISQCSYALNGSVSTTINVTYDIDGAASANLGNGFAMSTTVTGGTAAALSGGSSVGTDNSQGLANLGVFGRYITSLNGIGFTRFGRPGIYLFSYNNTIGCTWNWGKSKHLLADTVWFGTDAPSSSIWPWFIFTSTTHPVGYLIASTTIGANSVSLSTPAQASNFSVGDPIVVTSLDLQHYGYPPNVQNFEFNTIIAINPVTGLLTLERPIKYNHLSTYPDDVFFSSDACGAARVWALNCAPSSNPALSSITVPIVRWDYEAEIIGPIKVYYNADLLYLTYSGKSLKTYKWDGPAISFGRIERSKHEFDTYHTLYIPDKQVGQVEYDNCTFLGLYSPQSPSEFITFRNCSFFGGMQSGSIKQLLAEQCEFSSLSLGGNIYGYSRKQSFINNRVYNLSFDGNVTDGFGSAVTVDGTNILYANVNGYVVIKGLLSAAGVVFVLTGMPGTQIVFPYPSVAFSGDVAIGTVLRTYADSTYIYIVTDFSYAALPTTNSFALVQLYDIEFIGNTGCDPARVFSEACEAGKRYFERARFIFNDNSLSPSTSVSGTIQTGSNGQIVHIYANVRRAGTGTGTMGVKLVWETFNSASLAANTSPGLTVFIDGSVLGARDITQSAFTGKTGSDSILVDGSTPSSFLPVSTLVTFEYTWQYTVGTLLVPIVEIILEFDCGMTRRIIDQSTLINTTGALQP